MRWYARPAPVGNKPVLTSFRPDGWPLCPHCNADELRSLLSAARIRELQTLIAAGKIQSGDWLDHFIVAGMLCAACKFKLEPLGVKL